MRLFGVAMVRNEADVIELFVRHNLTVLDGLLIVDHGSCDGTGEILSQLQAEGSPVRVRSVSAPGFDQSPHVTALAREALARDHADFVFALDADEFLKVESREKLESGLAQVPAGVNGLVHWLTYVPDGFGDDAAGFGRDHLRMRIAHERHGLHKAIVSRAMLERPADTVWAGNHVVADSRTYAVSRQARLRSDVVALAHCPVRSRAQLESKIIVGYLAFVAASGRESNLAFHWRDLYEELRAGAVLTADRLREIALNYGLPREQWQASTDIELVEDPVELVVEARYGAYASADPLRLLMRFTEALIEQMT